MFWLVQRLVCKDLPEEEPSPLAPTRSAAGRFDDQFGCEYMGSSEFEWGAIPKAFQQMNGLKLEMRAAEITRKGMTRTVYFIVPSDPKEYADYDSDLGEVTDFEHVVAEFTHWFSSDYVVTCEQPHFEYYFSDAWPEYWSRGNVCAWWSLGDNIAWTLDEAIAQRLLEAFSKSAVAA